MYAIIQDGGKQYKVIPGQSVELEKKEVAPGSPIEFPEVLFYNDDKEILVGTPHVAGVKVQGIVEKQHRGEKLIVFKYIKSGNSHRKLGHRQEYTRVRICKISKQ